MIPAAFDYLRPATIDEAIAALADSDGEAKVLAGGHSLLPLMKLRFATPPSVIDIGALPGLSYIEVHDDHVAIGALTCHHDLATSAALAEAQPLLAHAAAKVGDPQVRHRGTIGGSLAHGDPASDLPAVVLALDGEVVVRGPGGERVVPASEFFLGFLETALEPDELLTEVRVPRDGGGFGFEKFTRRSQDWAIVGVAVARHAEGAGVALVNMATTPFRARATEAALAAGEGAAAAAEHADEGCDPVSDINASAEYRRHLARVPHAARARERRFLSDGAPASPSSPEELRERLAEVGYLADEGLSIVAYLSLALVRPLFLEGEPGAGKTELARALAAVLGAPLVRLQCYEGIDVSQAVYEWDYARQLLHLRAAELLGEREGRAEIEDELFSERFLVRRPLLKALAGRPGEARPVLLIDEIDRADDEFEAYLLEMLADYAVTVPELGTIRAEVPPVVVLTSNRTRDVHDALKRRSLYHWVEHPDFERELQIVALRAPAVPPALGREVTAAVQELRTLSLYKPPGVAETIDWAQALATLGASELEVEALRSTLGIVLKYREDAERVSALAPEVIERARAR